MRNHRHHEGFQCFSRHEGTGELGSQSRLPKTSDYLKTCLPVFPQAQSASFLLPTQNSFQGVLKTSSCSSMGFSACRGGWQGPQCGWPKGGNWFLKKYCFHLNHAIFHDCILAMNLQMKDNKCRKKKYLYKSIRKHDTGLPNQREICWERERDYIR